MRMKGLNNAIFARTLEFLKNKSIFSKLQKNESLL